MAITTRIRNPLRAKSLDGILSAFTRASADLDDFVKRRGTDVANINKEVDKMHAERSFAEREIARATRAKERITAIVA